MSASPKREYPRSVKILVLLVLAIVIILLVMTFQNFLSVTGNAVDDTAQSLTEMMLTGTAAQ